jgi:hypothetical protein
MRLSKLMKERIRRTTILLKELGFELLEGEFQDDTFTAGFESGNGFQGGIFIDRESKFLELGFTFSFSPELTGFIRERLEEMMQICYEFGCYPNLQAGPDEIEYSLFSKVYYAGLNYFSLKETLKDFQEAVEATRSLLEIPSQLDTGAFHGNN